MKLRLSTLFLVLFFMMVITTTVYAQGDQPVPPTVEDFPVLYTMLVGAITFVMTAGIQALAETWGVNITGRASQITAAAVMFVITTVNALLSALPPMWITPAIAIFTAIAGLLSAFGIARTAKKLRPQKGG